MLEVCLLSFAINVAIMLGKGLRCIYSFNFNIMLMFMITDKGSFSQFGLGFASFKESVFVVVSY